MLEAYFTSSTYSWFNKIKNEIYTNIQSASVCVCVCVFILINALPEPETTLHCSRTRKIFWWFREVLLGILTLLFLFFLFFFFIFVRETKMAAVSSRHSRIHRLQLFWQRSSPTPKEELQFLTQRYLLHLGVKATVKRDFFFFFFFACGTNLGSQERKQNCEWGRLMQNRDEQPK